MYYNLFVEFIGTFIFLYVVLALSQAIPIGIALTAMIIFGSAISGAHYNPAVSFMMWVAGKINNAGLISYILVQLVAAYCAYIFYKYTAIGGRIGNGGIGI